MEHLELLCRVAGQVLQKVVAAEEVVGSCRGWELCRSQAEGRAEGRAAVLLDKCSLFSL